MPGDVAIAKNYLDKPELDHLNRIVTMYLDFAELQAVRNKPMYMKDSRKSRIKITSQILTKR
ncbi:hypothetical protein METP1_02639 [Methanosarcinales archaeon]|nr:hypothetical protein METP1_02639 [Methanosarcinales archaeon]